MEKGTAQLIQSAVNALVNALSDHYFKSNSTLTQEEYWRKHLPLTKVQTVDSYLQGLVASWVEPGLSTVDGLVKKGKMQLGLS